MEEKATPECKNCSTEIEGPFCHFCGQRYHDHKESFGELAYEFVSDFLHFDSRFFKTVLPLIFQPGKLTKNYNDGKQRSQFHPIRLYLFSSFVYFFLFFYFNNVGESFDNKNTQHTAGLIMDSARNEIRKDSVNQAINSIISSVDHKESASDSAKTSKSFNKDHVVLQDPNQQIAFTATAYIDSLLKNNVTPEQYLAQQKTLSKGKKDGYFERIITLRLIKINLAGEEGKKEFFKKLTETFFHNIPKMLFFLLPVFALFLKLLYFRKKQFYYVDHAILSLHYFSLIFLLLIVCKYVLDKTFGTEIFTSVAYYWSMIYLYIAMKRLYKQSWGKTLVKYIALGFLMSIAILITIIGNMAWSAFMI